MSALAAVFHLACIVAMTWMAIEGNVAGTCFFGFLLVLDQMRNPA